MFLGIWQLEIGVRGIQRIQRSSYSPQEVSSLDSLGAGVGAGVEAMLGAEEATEPLGVTEGELLMLLGTDRTTFCAGGCGGE